MPPIASPIGPPIRPPIKLKPPQMAECCNIFFIVMNFPTLNFQFGYFPFQKLFKFYDSQLEIILIHLYRIRFFFSLLKRKLVILQMFTAFVRMKNVICNAFAISLFFFFLCRYILYNFKKLL